jgi:hypothetical protein
MAGAHYSYNSTPGVSQSTQMRKDTNRKLDLEAEKKATSGG